MAKNKKRRNFLHFDSFRKKKRELEKLKISSWMEINAMKNRFIQENPMGEKYNDFQVITNARERMVETQKERRMFLKGFRRIKLL